ncbi:MAG: signal peptidase II [Synergistaceae bacterium]|jgi:signal peptidase II|nr:signal peptidase II [Synergistaceae bacterium]
MRDIAKYFNGRFFFVLALALDRATKYWASSRFVPNKGERAFLSLGLHFNRGISFSWLENYPSLGLAVTLAAMGFLGVLCLRSKTARSMPGMALLWAGAAGNLADRLLYGYVVDWIYIFRGYVNLADVWLCVGGLAVLLRSLTERS